MLNKLLLHLFIVFNLFYTNSYVLAQNEAKYGTEQVHEEKSVNESINDPLYFDTTFEYVKSSVLKDKHIIITTEHTKYIFNLDDNMLKGLLPPFYHGKTNDEFEQWYTNKQMDMPILSDLVIDANHKSIHATLKVYQNSQSRDFSLFVINGVREGIEIQNNKTNEQPEEKLDNDFTLGFDASYNNDRLSIKTFNNHNEIMSKKIHEPFDKAGTAIHDATSHVISPLFLLFCKAPCMPGG